MSIAELMSATPLTKQRRALSLSRGRTSVYVEAFVWESFDAMCTDLTMPARIVADMIDMNRDQSVDFTSAFRVAVLAYWRSSAERRRWVPATHLHAAMVAIGGTPPAAPAP
ncbi:ribbon-helix-helix domain-containing protein [Azospirillum sp.]|uniref:ribbon-helix-helix domain-containing protein n=1 Tax=Azospirillum sp. TaxID=34012 RepID=UPI003D7540D7